MSAQPILGQDTIKYEGQYAIYQLDSILDSYMMSGKMLEGEQWALKAVEYMKKMDIPQLKAASKEYYHFTKIYNMAVGFYSRTQQRAKTLELSKGILKYHSKTLYGTPYYYTSVDYVIQASQNTGQTRRTFGSLLYQKKAIGGYKLG